MENLILAIGGLMTGIFIIIEFFLKIKEVISGINDVLELVRKKRELVCICVKDKTGQEFFTNFVPKSYNVETRWKHEVAKALKKAKALDENSFNESGYLLDTVVCRFSPDTEAHPAGVSHEENNYMIFTLVFNGELLRGKAVNYEYTPRITKTSASS